MAYDGSYLVVLDSCFKVSRMDTAGNFVDSFSAPSTPLILIQYLTFDGTNFWGSDGFDDLIISYDNTGSVISSFRMAANTFPSGLTWDGSHLWTYGWITERIYRLDTSGNVVSSFPVPSEWLEDIAFDGTYLWGADSMDGTLYKFKID